MSERGSFATEYIYCENCFKVVKSILNDSPNVEFHQIGEYPILAGKVSGMYAGEEVVLFENIAKRLSEAVCHSVRLCVFPDSIKTVRPITVHPRMPAAVLKAIGDIGVRKLFQVTFRCPCPEAYVVAEHPTEAYQRAREYFEKHNYKPDEVKELHSITLEAVEDLNPACGAILVLPGQDGEGKR